MPFSSTRMNRLAGIGVAKPDVSQSNERQIQKELDEHLRQLSEFSKTQEDQQCENGTCER